MSAEALNITVTELFKNRDKYKDIEPIYNSELEDGIVPIALNEEFIDAFSYLRALMNNNELSERALEVTLTCIKMNPAHYSVWEYRRMILKELNKNIEEELMLCEENILENLKNYQVWHHRRELIIWLGNKNVDMSFINNVLKDDVKNYHAWQHRVFLTKFGNVDLKSELNFTTEFILNDVFNNSAWAYRYFIISELSNNFENINVINEEIDFIMKNIQIAINNASSWSYLSGIMEFSLYSKHPEVVEFSKKLAFPNEGTASSQALSFTAEGIMQLIEEKQPVTDGLNIVRKCYEKLIELDPIRQRLWVYKLQELMNLSSV